MIFPCLPTLHRLGKLDSLGKLPSLGKLDGLGKLHRRKFKLIYADQTDQSERRDYRSDLAIEKTDNHASFQRALLFMKATGGDFEK